MYVCVCVCVCIIAFCRHIDHEVEMIVYDLMIDRFLLYDSCFYMLYNKCVLDCCVFMSLYVCIPIVT